MGTDAAFGVESSSTLPDKPVDVSTELVVLASVFGVLGLAMATVITRRLHCRKATGSRPERASDMPPAPQNSGLKEVEEGNPPSEAGSPGSVQQQSRP